MTTAQENLNNAFASLSVVNNGTKHAGIRRAIDEAIGAWSKWWRSSDRALILEDSDKLQRWLAWYTRCYALLTPEQQKSVPEPHTIDASQTAVIVDALRANADVYANAIRSGANAAGAIGAQAAAIGKGALEEIGDAAESVANAVLLIGAAVFAWWWFNRGK